MTIEIRNTRGDVIRVVQADLPGADLTGANLEGEVLRRGPAFVNGLRWDVTITEAYMRIGCQRHRHEEWAGFSDAEISAMADGAVEFWRARRGPLLSLCEQHRLGG